MDDDHDDDDDDKDDDADDGDDMMLLIYCLKVVGAQRGSVLNYRCATFSNATNDTRRREGEGRRGRRKKEGGP